MSWKGLVKVTFPSHLQTLMALFPKSKVLKGQVSRSDNTGYIRHREKRANRENGKKIPSLGKHREFGNFAKTQGKHRGFGLLKL